MSTSSHSTSPAALGLPRLPTPIEELRRLPAALGLPGRLFVKRDDLTGCALSGNKIRKLDFLLKDALDQGADTVITCGGIQSNHARATAVAAARLGLRARLVLRGQAPEDGPLGNLALGALVGARVRWISPEQYPERDAIMAEEAAALRAAGRRPYVIPEGGSNALGARGYSACVDEILEQERALGLRFTAVATAVGSGGTTAGLLAGKARREAGFEVVGFPVCDDSPLFQRRIAAILEAMAEAEDRPELARQRPRLIDDYKGIGYALSTPEEDAFLRRVARSEGLILDPCYTNKALRGLVSEAAAGRFGPEPRLLFIHTGGIFGALARSWSLETVTDG